MFIMVLYVSMFFCNRAEANEGFDAQPLDLTASGDRFQTVPDAASIVGDFHPQMSFTTNYSYSPSWGDIGGGQIPAFQVYGNLSGSMNFLGKGHFDFNIPLQYTPERGVLLSDSTLRLKTNIFGSAKSIK